MALNLTFNFGRLLSKAERITNAKINAIAKGITASLTGTVGTADLGDASVTPAKVSQGAYFYATATFALGTYTAAYTPSVAAYVDGMVLCFKALSACTGATNFDAGAGAKPVRKWGGKSLEVGDIAVNDDVNVRYNTTLVGGGCWELVAVPSQPLRDDYRYGGVVVPTGTAPTNYALTLANAPASYVAGMMIAFRPNGANTGTGVTVNVNGLGVQNLTKGNGAALVAGEIQTARLVVAIADGSGSFQVISPLATIYTPAEAVRDVCRNLVMTNNAGTPNSKVDITADEILLKETATGHTYLASAVAVTVDITALGVVNGLDTGAEAASTWYYIWAISDGATVAGLLSASATAPTLPATYIYKALLGCVRNDAGSNFLTFWQTGRDAFLTDQVIFTGKAGVLAYTVLAGADLTAFQAAVPPIARVARGSAGTNAGSRTVGVANDTAGLGLQFCSASATNLVSGENGSTFAVPLKTAQQLAWKAPDTGAIYRISVFGYSL